MAEPTTPATTVRVRLADGRVGTVPSSLAKDVEADGGQLLTPEENAQRDLGALRSERQSTGLGLAEKLGNVGTLATSLMQAHIMPGGMIGFAAGLGGGRSALAELSGTDEGTAYAQGREDAMTLGIGKNVRKFLVDQFYGKGAAEKYVTEKKLERALSPNAYQHGQVEGGIEGAAVAGMMPVGGIARALGLGAKATEAGAAVSAARAAAGLGAETTTAMAARHAAAGAVARMGARGAVENALVGAGTELNEQMFGDPELNGTKIALAGAEAGLIGGFLGVGLGVAAPHITRALAKGANAAELGASRLERWTRVKAGPEANAQSAKALSPHLNRTVVRKVEAEVAGGMRELGEFNRRVAIDHTNPLKNSPEHMIERIESYKTKVNGEIGKIYETATERIGVEELEAAFNKVVHEAPTEGGRALSKSTAREASVRQVTEIRDSLLRNTGMLDNQGKPMPGATISVKDLWEQNKSIGDWAWKEHGALEAKGPVEAVRDFKRQLDDILERKVAKSAEGEVLTANDNAAHTLVENDNGPRSAAEAYGNSRLAWLKFYKSEVHKGILSVKLAEDGIAKNLTNKNFGMTELLAGTAMGAATGDPITAIATAKGARVVRDHGNGVAAVLLSKVNDMAMIDKLTRRIDQLVATAADGASGTAKTKLAVRPAADSGASLLSEYRSAVAHVRALDDAASMSPANIVHPFPTAPLTSEAILRASARAVSYLATSIPKTSAQITPGHEPRPSNPQMRDFVSKYEALTDPAKTLSQVAAGSLDPAKTRALQSVAPEVFEDLKDATTKKTIARIEKALAGRGEMPSQQELTKLHLAFGITLDPTLTPKALFDQQEAAALGIQEPENGQSPRAQRGRANSMKSQRTPTGADRFER